MKKKIPDVRQGRFRFRHIPGAGDNSDVFKLHFAGHTYLVLSEEDLGDLEDVVEAMGHSYNDLLDQRDDDRRQRP